MPGIQEILHKLEEGSGKRYIKAALLLLLMIAVLIVYNFRSFRNMNTQEAMDSAQLARNLAAGEGYTTQFIRPLSISLHRQQALKGAEGLATLQVEDAGRLKQPHPDISNPPVYPLMLAGLMKVLPFKHDSLTPAPFWYKDSRFMRYQPDFLIALANQLLMVALWVATWFLARRLFDEEAAWIGTLCLLGTDLLWRFSVSGLSTLLLLLLMSGILWLLHLLENEAREPKRGLKGLLLVAGGLGLLVGFGGLTRYAFLWMILPVLGYLLIYGGRLRLAGCGAVLGAFLLVMTPWLVRNIHHSGLPFGTATYAPLEESGTFTADRLQRSLQLDIGTEDVLQVRHKMVNNMRALIQEGDFGLGGTWVIWLFVAGLLVPFRNPGTQRLRYFILAAFVTLFVVQTIGQTRLSAASPEINSENLLVLLVPALVIYGTAFFLMLIENIKWSEPIFRRAAIVAFIVLSSLPLLLALIPPRPSAVAYPPYFPPHIQKIASWMKPDELIMSDVPWAVAWYGNRQSLWLTLDVSNDFYAINDYQKPIKGLYLTPVTMDGGFASTFLRSGDFSWGDFILKSMYKGELPKDFPLSSATRESLFWPEEVFLTD